MATDLVTGLVVDEAFARSHVWHREARWKDGSRRARSEEVAYFCSKMDASCRVRKNDKIIIRLCVSASNVYGRNTRQIEAEGTDLDDTLMDPHPRVRHLQLSKNLRVFERNSMYI